MPWCHAAPALAPDGLRLALKSGNFGTADFFSEAAAYLDANGFEPLGLVRLKDTLEARVRARGKERPDLAFERSRDPTHTRALADVDMRTLFESNGLVLLRNEYALESRELGPYLELAGCEGEAREPLEWRHAARIVASYRHWPRPKVILSGGLTPENVAAAIA